MEFSNHVDFEQKKAKSIKIRKYVNINYLDIIAHIILINELINKIVIVRSFLNIK